MRSKLILTAVVCLGAIAALGASVGAGRPPSQAWEYRIMQETVNNPAGSETNRGGLNELGKEGWELVAVTPPRGDYPNYVFYLKRPK